jgi:hypothetical protein
MTTIRRPRDLEADEAEVFDAVERQLRGVAEHIGPCPDPRRLQDAHAGRLGDADTRAVLSHAAACRMCQALVEALATPDVDEPSDAERRRIDARVTRATETRPGTGSVLPFRPRWSPRGVAALAVAAATLLALVVPRALVGPGPLPPAPPPPRIDTMRPSLTVTLLRPERLATRGMGLAGLSWRGDAAIALPASPFDEARMLFDRGDFAGAERRLDEITSRTPSFADAWLLLGVSRLMLERPSEAIAPLERANRDLVGLARQDASWHLAVALHAAGRDTEARTLLSALCNDRTARAPMACLALFELRPAAP